LANEFTKDIKTQHDLNDFSKMLTKLKVKTALNAELTEHLGYEKHQNSPEDLLLSTDLQSV
jgi:putative transposase